jgi:hypothetical protein
MVVAAMLITTVPVSYADVVEIRWSPDGHFAHKGAIAAAKFVEVCGKLRANERITWDFEVSTPVDFNVHYHEGKEVVFPAKLASVTTAHDTLDTKIQQDYCWMWSNASDATAKFSITLQR